MAIRHVVLLGLVTQCVPLSGQTYTFTLENWEQSYEFVRVGAPGNAAQTTDSFPYSMGGVQYEYSIGKYEVSCGEIGGVNCRGFDDGPIVGDWHAFAAFANQLNRSFGFPGAYKLDSERAVLWKEGTPEYDSENPLRNRLSNFALPTTDEWHKAAFFDPERDKYWLYATGSDSPPRHVAEGTEQGTAVFGMLAASTRRAGGLSPYGTMGQTGNVAEWEESYFNPEIRSSGHGVRPGSDVPPGLSTSVNGRKGIGFELPGFRIVSLGRASPFDCDASLKVDAADLACSNEARSTDGLLLHLGLIPGDLNGDGHVEFADFLILAENFGSSGSTYTQGDIDGVGGVGMSDFLILSSNFGSTANERVTGSVPEPGSAALVIVGVWALAPLRRWANAGLSRIR